MAKPILSVRTNVEDVLASLDGKIASIKNTAVPRTLNKVRDQCEVAAAKIIASAYGISKANFRKYGRVQMVFATADNKQAAIVVGGYTFPLDLFPHRQTAQGVVVTLHGKQYLFPHAFMIKGRGRRVYARGTYGRSSGRGTFRGTGEKHWNLQYGRGRFPITILRTMSPRGVFAKADVRQAMHDRAREQMPKVLQQEIRFAVRSSQ